MKNMTLMALGLLATASARHSVRTYPGVTFMPDNEFVMGVDKDDLMQNNPSHWRKSWPEGNTDNGQDDSDVLARLGTKKRSHKDAADKINYPWAYDEDVIHTGNSLALSEDMTGKQMTKDGVGYSHRGLDWSEGVEFFKFPRTDVAPPHSDGSD